VIRKVIAVVVGLIVGALANMMILMVSILQNPLPEGMDVNDAKQMAEYVNQLPLSAFMITLAAHAGGALAGAFVCSAIMRKRWLRGMIIIGTVIMIGGIINLYSISHPTWFAIADVLLYLPAALVGGFLAKPFWKAGETA